MIRLLQYYAKRPFHFVKTGLLQGVPAQFKYRFPNRKLTITIISGTDGKTTTSSLLYHILKTGKLKVGLISTVAAYIGQDESDTGFHVTSPQPKDMYQFMRKMVDLGFTHLVLETTSHGAYQYRAWGITPRFSGLTNIAQEHLDYHITYKEYVKAKLSILKKAKVLYLNEDDASFSTIKKLYPLLNYKTYSESDELPSNILKAIKQRFPESYNQMNARLATKLALEHGLSEDDITTGIATFPGVPGRMEVITNTPCKVIVDFAHTPQGLEAVLSQLAKQKKPGSKLIAVFGCAGLRDRGKRPVMGKIAAELADLAVFTAEDPRTEDVWSIIRQMKEGLTEHHNKILSIPDRRAAIQFAIEQLVTSKDTVAVLGKGHEQSMCFGTTERPWSDAQAVREIVEALQKKK